MKKGLGRGLDSLFGVYGNDVTQDVIKDLLKVRNVFIEKNID